ncbi:hypothetical protein [Methyloferula stellata]|uniref:hypothetical protein n=1 Tax=Methyloferula stellata TaxID=876270 RepID=UPI0003765082|nr:hypothetical protein [Methyloferula stellata]
MGRYVLEDERLFARLYELDRAVASLNELKTVAPFETIIRVSADFGMMVEAALTPRQAELMRAGVPILTTDASGKRVRQLKLFDGRFTLEWLFVKHVPERGAGI